MNPSRWIPVFALGLFACGGGNDDAVDLQGTVEVREVDVAPIAAGRVLRVLVDEGDQVQGGDTIAILDAPNLEGDLAAARARLTAAESRLADLGAGARESELEIARSSVASARSDSSRLAREEARLRALLDAGAVAVRDHEDAESALEVAVERLRAARESLRLLELGARQDVVAAARAEVSAARAALQVREATSAEYVLTASVDGVVISRVADPGDLLAVGSPAVVLGVIAEPWVRVFVPARVLPMVNVGDTVAIYPPGAGGAVDQDNRAAAADPSAPSNGDGRARGSGPGSGRIIAISPQAEFVTRVALTPEERADLLFGVRVAIDPPSDRFKPGLPVTVRIPLRDGQP